MKANYGLLVWDGLIKIQKALMIFTGIATICLVFLPMIFRIVNIPFVGYEEILLTVAFWMYMLGSSHGSYEKSQITADILGQFLSGRKKDIYSAISSVCTFILGAVFTYWGYVLVHWSASTWSTSSTFHIPYVVGQSSILVSLILSSIYNFVYMIKDIKQLLNK